MSFLNELSMEDLYGEQKEIAEVIGLDNYKKLVKIFGGNYIRIHQEDTLVKEKRDNEICRRYNGENILQLSQEYGLSDRSIRTIVAAIPKDMREKAKAKRRNVENQISFFH